MSNTGQETKETDSLGAGGVVQWKPSLGALSDSQPPRGGLQPPVTPVPDDPKASSGLQGHCTDMCTGTHVDKIPYTHKNKTFKKERPCQGRKDVHHLNLKSTPYHMIINV